MTVTISLSDMRTRVRDNIDEPSANYWANAELNRGISRSQSRLWRRIYAIKKDFFLSPNGFVLNVAVNKYKYTQTLGDMPSDFFRLTAIRTTTSGMQDVVWVPVDPNSEVFIAGLRSDVPITLPNTFFYSVRNNNELWISPLPQTAFAAQVDYIQQPVQVVNDADTFMPILDPFLDYVEFDSTMRALAKGPVGDLSTWRSEREEAWKEIVEALDTPRNDQGPDVVRGFMEDGVF